MIVTIASVVFGIACLGCALTSQGRVETAAFALLATLLFAVAVS